jgi:hypothetical protein
MGFLDRLFGGDETDEAPPRRRPLTEDERAVERYRYLLRTAPPETIEQVHAEAFGRLSEQQRAQIYEELSRDAGTGERPLSSEPATLARAATRAEMRNPGTLERSFQGPSFGGMIAGSLLGTVAGYVIGSALVSAFLPWDAGYDAAGADSGADPGSADGSDASADAGGVDDFGSDFGGGDFGGDFGF